MSFPKLKRMRRIEGTFYKAALLTAATIALTFPKKVEHWQVLNSAAGQTITLPASTGKGGILRLYVGTTITSGSTVIRSKGGTDIINGLGTVGTTSFQTASNTNTITMNGSTTGGVVGGYIELQDMLLGQWKVELNLTGTGTFATPYSNT